MSKFDAICVQLAVNIAHAPLMQKKAPICERGNDGAIGNVAGENSKANKTDWRLTHLPKRFCNTQHKVNNNTRNFG